MYGQPYGFIGTSLLAYSQMVPTDPQLTVEDNPPRLCLDLKSEHALQNQRKFAMYIGGPSVFAAGYKLKGPFGLFVMGLGAACTAWHAAYQHNAMQTFGYGDTTQNMHQHEPGGQWHHPEIPISPSKFGRKRRRRSALARRGHQLSRYRAFGSLEEAVTSVGQEADAVLDQAVHAIEEAGSGVVHAMEDVATRQRQRQAVFMVAAPLIVFSGLTNQRHRAVGFAAALAGALIGFRHYHQYQNVEDLRRQAGLK